MGYVKYQDRKKFNDVHVFTNTEEFWMFHLMSHSGNIIQLDVVKKAIYGVDSTTDTVKDVSMHSPQKLLDKLHQEDRVLMFGEGFYAADPKVLYTVHPKLLLMKLDLLFLHVTPDVATSVSEHLINEKVDNSLYYAASSILARREPKIQRIPPIYQRLNIRYPSLNRKCGLPFALALIVEHCGTTTIKLLYEAVNDLFTTLTRTRYGVLFAPLLDLLDRNLFEEALCYLEVNRVVEVKTEHGEAKVKFRRHLAVTDEPSSYNMLLLAMVFNRRDYINDVYREPEEKTINETALMLIAKHLRIDTGYPVILAGLKNQYRAPVNYDL